MPGVKQLRKIQMGKESPAGDKVDATFRWWGTGVLEDKTVIKSNPALLGQLQAHSQVYIPEVGAAITLDPTPLTFEQYPYLICAGIDGAAVAGVRDGTTGDGYLYTGTLANTAQKAPLTYTIEGGDDNQEYETGYGFILKHTISGKPREALMMSAEWMGRQVASGSFTASITAPTAANIEVANFGNTKLYLHASAFGSGLTTNTLVGFSIEIPGFAPIWSADGQVYFAATKQTNMDVTGELLLEHNSTATAEVVAAVAGTVRYMRLLTTGSAITIGNGAWATKGLRIDMGIQYTAVPKLEDLEDDDVLRFPFRMVQVTAGGVILCVNKLSALT